MSALEQLGQYDVLEPIGEGGMGTVYLGEHHLLRHQVAIKLLHERHLNNPAMKRRFQNEAQAIAALDHPGVVKLFDIGRTPDDRAYVVMELLRGQSLRRRLGERGLPPDRALPFAVQIASALDAAHQAGIVHRDLKPENIFIVRDPDIAGGERVKILDFGIAKRTKLTGTPRPEITRTGILVGTPNYMAPEQCRCDDQIDARADIYAFGVVLYEMLTGSLPFSGADTEQMIAQQLYTAPRPLDLPDLPAGLSEVVMRCLAKKPAARYQSMFEVGEVLAAMVGRPQDLAIPEEHEPSSSDAVTDVEIRATSLPRDDATTRVHQRPAPERRPRWFFIAGAAAAIAIAALATITGGDGDEPRQPAATTVEESPAPATEVAAEPDALIEMPAIAADTPDPAPRPTRAKVGGGSAKTTGESASRKKSSRARKPKPKRVAKPKPKPKPKRPPAAEGDPFAEIEPPTLF